ncbi:MAG: pyruvate ferredoxin oxidoreductase [Clostridiales Family XIII bacterium]|nr:pyruvate ferredoxin oxidoreductase [Clostridiales Family XIII bacterium]
MGINTNRTKLDTGNNACAEAVKLAAPDIIAAYPITPQTSVSEKLASYVDEGVLHARYIPVESEHSAISAVAAASAAGARTFTATSSQGILYMNEILHYTAGGRLPVVLVNVNRAINAPWCLYVDHQDSASQRDTGWLQLYAGDNQEIHDYVLLAYRTAEEAMIPTMVCYDGFLLSHSMLPYEPIEEEIARKYLPDRDPDWCLHPAYGRKTFAQVTPAFEYSEFRKRLAQESALALDVIKDRGAELDALTGHNVCSHVKPYRNEDADYLIVSMGSMGVEAEMSADILRNQGIKAGSLRVRTFRPFPAETFVELIPEGTSVIVLDRNYAYGTGGGIILQELKEALYGRKVSVRIAGTSIGVGGMELPAQHMADTVKDVILSAWNDKI